MKKTKMIKKNFEFRNVLSKGKYYSGKYIDAYIKNNSSKTINYLGIAINTKIAKAVIRNKIKRLIRENYKILEDEIQCGKNIVFLWKKNIDIEFATFKNIEEDMNNIFDKAKIRNKEI